MKGQQDLERARITPQSFFHKYSEALNSDYTFLSLYDRLPDPLATSLAFRTFNPDPMNSCPWLDHY